MKKLAVLFFVAILVPCGVLGWLAWRALKEEEGKSSRQEIALAQQETARIARKVNDMVAGQIVAFEKDVDQLLTLMTPEQLATELPQEALARWPIAQTAFALQVGQGMVTPQKESGPNFLETHEAFLTGTQPASGYSYFYAQDLPLVATRGDAKAEGAMLMGGMGGNMHSTGFFRARAQSGQSHDDAELPLRAAAKEHFVAGKTEAMNESENFAARESDAPKKQMGDAESGGVAFNRARLGSESDAWSATESLPATEAAPLDATNGPHAALPVAGKAYAEEAEKKDDAPPRTSQVAAEPEKPGDSRKVAEAASAPSAPMVAAKDSTDPKDSPAGPSPPPAAPVKDVAQTRFHDSEDKQPAAASRLEVNLAATDQMKGAKETGAARQENLKLTQKTEPMLEAAARGGGESPPMAAPSAPMLPPASPAVKAKSKVLAESDGKLDDAKSPGPAQDANELAGEGSEGLVVESKAAARRLRTTQAKHLTPDQQALAGRLSSIHPAHVSFGELLRQSRSGLFTREDGTALLYYRPTEASGWVFGLELIPGRWGSLLESALGHESSLPEAWCFALLDSSGRVVVQSLRGWQGGWSEPFVAVEIGTSLPHWEVAAQLLDPAALSRAASVARMKLGMVFLLVVGGALIGAILLWREAQRRMREARQKTDFVSNVSHELRTPLTSIQMFSDLLANPATARDDGKARRYAEVISKEARRLSRLIDDLLDFSRLERQAIPLQLARIDLAELCCEVLGNFRGQLESAGLRVECNVPATPVWISGDKDRLAQVLVNLLGNAEKYGATGGEVTLQLEKGAEPATAVISVMDRGPGVPRGKEKKIFEKFYRAEDALHSTVPGTGLGLALARQIVRAHQGEIAYHPRDGGGSVFAVTLPRIE